MAGGANRRDEMRKQTWAAVLAMGLSLSVRASAQARDEPVAVSEKELQRLRARISQLESQLAEARGRGAEQQMPAVQVEFVGRVRDVGPQRIDVLDEEGNTFRLELDAKTQTETRQGPISASQLPEGAAVRVIFDFHDGRSQARRIELLPSDSPAAKELNQMLSR
jgi:hypothetical protein